MVWGGVISLRPPVCTFGPGSGGGLLVGGGKFTSAGDILLNTAAAQSPWDHSVWVKVIPFHSARLITARQGIWATGVEG